MSRPGLVAWIVEKFHGWSDNDGDVENAFTKDEMLTNITLYWVTETITSGGARTVGGRHPCVLQAAEVEGLAVAGKSI